MKAVCILLLCMATLACAYFDDESAEVEVRTRRKEQKLSGGYTFVTEDAGNGKYRCECFRGGRKVWNGMCGVKAKNFSYRDCI